MNDNPVFVHLALASSGFGKYGELEYDPERNAHRCHACGGWFKRLATHSLNTHKMRQREYCEKYGLPLDTLLLVPSLASAYSAGATPALRAEREADEDVRFERIWRERGYDKQEQAYYASRPERSLTGSAMREIANLAWSGEELDGGKFARRTPNSGEGCVRRGAVVPLKNADKPRVIQSALADPEMAKLSNREIARRIGVSGHSVGDWRKRLAAREAA